VDTSRSDDNGDPEAAQHWDYFLLRSLPTLTTTPVAGVSLAAAYLRVHDRNFGPTLPPEPESSFRVSVAIRPMRLKALWADERWVSHLDHGRYSIGIYDMERRPTVEFIDPFELVQFYVPQRALTHFARESRLAPIAGLRIPEPGTSSTPFWPISPVHCFRPFEVPPAQAGSLSTTFISPFWRICCISMAS
jgi:hypothetical protein